MKYDGDLLLSAGGGDPIVNQTKAQESLGRLHRIMHPESEIDRLFAVASDAYARYTDEYLLAEPDLHTDVNREYPIGSQEIRLNILEKAFVDMINARVPSAAEDMEKTGTHFIEHEPVFVDPLWYADGLRAWMPCPDVDEVAEVYREMAEDWVENMFENIIVQEMTNTIAETFQTSMVPAWQSLSREIPRVGDALCGGFDAYTNPSFLGADAHEKSGAISEGHLNKDFTDYTTTKTVSDDDLDDLFDRIDKQVSEGKEEKK